MTSPEKSHYITALCAPSFVAVSGNTSPGEDGPSFVQKRQKTTTGACLSSATSSATFSLDSSPDPTEITAPLVKTPGHRLGAHLIFENETFKGPHSPPARHYNRSSWANITWQWGRFYKINNWLRTPLTAVMFTEWNTAIHRQHTAYQHSPRQGDKGRNCEAHSLSAKCTTREAGPSL